MRVVWVHPTSAPPIPYGGVCTLCPKGRCPSQGVVCHQIHFKGPLRKIVTLLKLGKQLNQKVIKELFSWECVQVERKYLKKMLKTFFQS